MYGVLCSGEGCSGVMPLRGVPFAVETVPEGWFFPRRWRRSQKRLRSRGVRTVLVQPGLPALTPGWGLHTMEVLPLLMALAPLQVSACQRKLGLFPSETTLAVAGERLTPEVWQLLFRLSAQARYLELYFPRGAEAAAQRLCYHCGASAVAGVDAGKSRAQIFLSLSPGTSPEKAAVVTLSPAENGLLRQAVLPSDWDIPPWNRLCLTELYAALWAAGALSLQEIPLQWT